MNEQQITEQLRLTNLAIQRLAEIVDEISVNAYNASETVTKIMLDEK